MLDYFSVLARLNRQRKKVLEDTDNSDITRYLLRPFAELSEDLAEQRLLAIDFETTGLNPQKDHIIAIGGVEVSDSKIALATAFHHHVKSKHSLSGSNVAVHSITDTEVQAGLSLRQALLDLIKRCQGRQLLVHFSKIEREFLRASCKNCLGYEVPFQFVDTFDLGKSLLNRKDLPLTHDNLSLAGLRRRFHLPSFSGHHALNDAIATAELYLALKNNY